MRLKLLIIMTIIASLLISACGSTEKPDTTNPINEEPNKKEVTITFWDTYAGPNRTPYYEALIKEFNKEFPHIKVNYVGIPSDSSKQKLDLAIETREVPDIAQISFRWISDFAERGAIIPLDNYFENWSEKDNIATAYISEIRNLLPENKLYQLPFSANSFLFWYRPDWFAQAGVEIPQTWDAFFEYAEKFTDPAEKNFGFTIRGGAGSISQLEAMIWDYSGINTYFDNDGISKMNDPMNVEFVDRLTALYNKYTPESDLTNGITQMIAEFDAGSVAMMYHNLGSYGDHAKTLGEGKFAAFSMPPSSVNGKRVFIINPDGFGIFKESKHPDEAWEFVSFLARASSQSYWNQNIGQMPTNSVVLEDEWVKNNQPIQEMMGVLDDENTMLITPPTYLPDYASIQKEMEPKFQAVLLKHLTAKEFMDEWAKLLTESNQRYASLKK